MNRFSKFWKSPERSQQFLYFAEGLVLILLFGTLVVAVIAALVDALDNLSK
ncbi:hypothetical protein D3C83_263250 [compost metagenome]